MGDRVYLGKPENQKDPRATNAFKNNKRHQQPRVPNPDKPATRPIPVVLPVTDEEAQMRTGSPYDDAIFTRGITIKECDAKTYFNASTPTLLETSWNTFQQMATDDVNITKILLSEYFDYYVTFQLWCRFTAIKAANQRTLTANEEWLLQAIKSKEYAIPSPVAIYLRTIGNVVTESGQHLYLDTPDLPAKVVSTKPGFFGPIDVNTHNLYEDLPCLGVLAEAVQAAVSDTAPGLRTSVLSTAKLTVNFNLLGFRHLGYRRSDAKNLAYMHGITADAFTQTRVNTGINIGFINAISDVVASISTFKVEKINHLEFSRSGQLSQLIPLYPLPEQAVPHANGDLQAMTVNKFLDRDYGVALFTCSQLMRLEKESSSWVCVTPVEGETIPQGWIDNRNIRRDLPSGYYATAFTQVSQNGVTFRNGVISSLITAKR